MEMEEESCLGGLAMGSIGRAALIELRHSRNHEEPKYIALEDLNFAWLEEEILLVMRMWNEGRAIWDIADALKRPQEEVLILLVDMSMKGGIKERIGGVYGAHKRV